MVNVWRVRIATICGFMCSSTIVLAQTVPGVPEDFKSWPMQSILGLITLASLAIVFFALRKTFSTLEKSAENQGKAVVLQEETNTRLDELCSKIGSINKQGD